MNQHVPNLDLCKQLKEAGYPQESEFRWVFWLNPENAVLWRKEELTSVAIGEPDVTPKDIYHVWDKGLAAPLATEILERLPEIPDYVLMVTAGVEDKKGEWYVSYTSFDTTKEPHLNIMAPRKSLPDALAEMWLWLKDNNYL